MGIINRIFNGRLDYDTHPYRVPQGNYVEALNITRDSEGMNSDGPIGNIIGNRLVPYTFPSGQQKTIGNEPDKVRNRIYNFVWNSTGKHTILFYDNSSRTNIKIFENLTDSGGVDILHWNPSFRINHIDIIYKDSGDLISWTDGLTPPHQLNVALALAGAYGVWQESYINVIKAPPQIPPSVVFEDDNTISVNNFRKKLFIYKYEFEYDDFEQTVTSSRSVLALPINYTDAAIDKDPTKNSRVAIVVQTGSARVKKIRILAAQNIGNIYSDFFLIHVIDKAIEGIPDNDITTYRFFNNQAYIYINVKQSLLAFDWVPQTAFAQCLPNGNVLCYGGITEGYDLPRITGSTSVSSIDEQTTQLPFIYVASQSGNSGFGIDDIHVIVIGSIAIGDTFNTYTTTKIITFAATATTTANVIAGLAAAAIIQGFTIVFSDTENLIITQANESLQRIYVTAVIRAVTDSPIWDNSCRYEPALIYFDAYGRTCGAVTKQGFAVQTPIYSKAAGIQQITKIGLSITSRPPLEAVYFQILFSKNTTESTLLDWVSDRTYKDADYAYISIENLNAFISDNPTTSLGYTFAANDRIRFMQILSGSVNTIYGNTFDFDIQASVINPVINGKVQSGQFIKIVLPTISGIFDFGSADFQNYFIKLYTPAQSVANGLDVYYEISQRYAIGNAGTANAFHQGMLQNQTANLGTPATFEFTQGDFYYRKRTVNTGGKLSYGLTPGRLSTRTILGQTLTKQSLPSDNYIAALAVLQQNFVNNYNSPGWTITVNAFQEIFTVKGNIYLKAVNATAAPFRIQIYVVHAATTTTYVLGNQSGPITAGQNITFTPNIPITIPPNSRTFLVLDTTDNNFSIDLVAGGLEYIEATKNYTVGIVDPNFSDFFPSAVNSYGRPWVVDENAKKTFYPTLRRNGGEYQKDTTINNINRFYFDVQDTYNRSFGGIKKLFVTGSKMHVLQEFDIGVVPVKTQVVQDVTGNPLQANSDILLNKIYYPYIGKIGIGTVPESFAHGKFAMYGCDNNKGIIWRLSDDGLTILSVLYKTNSFFIPKLAPFRKDLNNGIAPAGQVYTGDPSIFGVYDAYTNKYIVALQEINRYSDPNTLIFHQDPSTLTFLETRNESEGFESPVAYHPENMGCLDNLIVMYKDGAIWTLDNPITNNFFGVQYDSYIDVIFNDLMTAKKTWEAVMQTGNVLWDCPQITTSLISFGTTPQQSVLITEDFALLEGEWNAAFLRDQNSQGGIINGDTLKGLYIIIRFRAKDASSFVFLNSASVKFIDSALNSK